jgi:RHS repeat-associated protein
LATAENQIVGGSYDAAGNLLGDGVHTYSYDAENRIRYVDAGSTGLYVYDAAGQRVAKAAGSVTTYYIYGADSQVVSERDASNNWVQTYIQFGGQPVGLYRGSNTGFLHQDHLGSTRLVTLSDRSVYENMDYLPFGEQIAGGSGTTHKFTGYERDGETGLDFASARHYSSGFGRFMSPDPLSGSPSNPQSWNRYAYVNNNPLNATDPSGLCSEEDGWSGCDNAPWNDPGSWNYGAVFSYNAGFDQNGFWTTSDNSFCCFSNPSAQPWFLNPGATGTPQGNLGSFLYGAFVGFASSIGGDPASNIPDPSFRQYVTQQMQPLSTLEAKGRMIGPLLGLFIPGFGEEEAAQETVTLFRAVGNAEYADLAATGIFRAGSNSYASGKFFAESAEHAMQWGNALEGAGNFRTVEAQFPKSAADQFMRWDRLDSIGPARFGTFKQMGRPKVKLRP